MIRDVILPQLAMGMSEGTIVDWAVAEGEHVARDAPLLSIETEKVVTDIPAPCAGWLHRMAEPGGAIPVETVIGKIAETEAEYRSLLAIGPGDAVLATSAPPPALALAPGQDRASLEPTTRSSSRRVKVSGLARKIAAQRAVDLGTVTGTGPGGRIVRRDVESALERRGASSATTAPAPPPPRDTGAAMRVRARVPMTGMRKAIAERMLRSKTTAAHAYVFFEVDVTRLLAARATMLEREKELGTRVSMIALYAKALSIAVRQVPACNATLQEQEIVIWDNVNIGIAVALPGKTGVRVRSRGAGRAQCRAQGHRGDRSGHQDTGGEGQGGEARGGRHERWHGDTCRAAPGSCQGSGASRRRCSTSRRC